MTQKKKLIYLITGCLLVTTVYAPMAQATVDAQSISLNSEEIFHTQRDLRGEITQRLNDPEVTRELDRLNIDKSEVKMRLAAMSDRELQQVRDGVERQAGGEVIIISLTTILLIAIIVLLLR